MCRERNIYCVEVHWRPTGGNVGGSFPTLTHQPTSLAIAYLLQSVAARISKDQIQIGLKDSTFQRSIVIARARSLYLSFSFPYYVLKKFLRSMRSILLPLARVCSLGQSSLGLGPNPSTLVSPLYIFIIIYTQFNNISFLAKFVYIKFFLCIFFNHISWNVVVGLVLESTKIQVSF